jgi:hypothetical protein
MYQLKIFYKYKIISRNRRIKILIYIVWFLMIGISNFTFIPLTLLFGISVPSLIVTYLLIRIYKNIEGTKES